MADTKTAARLLDELTDPAQRRQVAKELRQLAESFAGVPDGAGHGPHTWAVGSLARSGLMGVDALLVLPK